MPFEDATAAASSGPASQWAAPVRPCRSVFAYEQQGRLGEGTYGVVFRGKDVASGELCALKSIKASSFALQHEGFPLTALRETGVLLRLRHANVVGLREVVVEDAERCAWPPYCAFMVQEHFDHDLRQLLLAFGASDGFSQGEVKSILEQLLRGLAALHERWVLHRDVKTANVLYANSGGRVALCDLGMARRYEEPRRSYTPECVTLHYRSPEMLLGERKYGPPSDVWSLGCLFAELVLKRTLLPGEGELDQLCRVVQLLGPPDERSWPALAGYDAWQRSPLAKGSTDFASSSRSGGSARQRLRAALPRSSPNGLSCLQEQGVDLLARMLEYNPASRITAQDALRHAYFAAEAPPPTPPSQMPAFDATTKAKRYSPAL